MKKRILIADDENDVFEFLKRILTKRFKCEVDWAENGLEAIKLLESENFNGMILDVQMPILDGYTALKKLKQTTEFGDFPVLMCTSVSDKEKVRDLMALGIQGYLLKPIRSAEAVERIEAFVNSINPQ